MVGKYCASEKERKVKVMRRLHELEQGLSERPFPIPKIDQLVDATFGHPRMSFFDAFQGYHQIVFALEDQEKTSFITPTCNYHYMVMSFGLK